MLKRTAVALGVLIVTFGCGGTNTFEGSVDGNEINIAESIFMPLTHSTTGNIYGAMLVMTDATEVCAMFQAFRRPPGATYVSFALIRTEVSGSQIVPLEPNPATYTVVREFDQSPRPLNFSIAGFVTTDAGCSNTIPYAEAEATSGTVEVQGIELRAGGWLTGKFDVTYGTQRDQVTGTFHASFCEANPFYTSPSCG
jgi:hypothetical protein